LVLACHVASQPFGWIAGDSAPDNRKDILLQTTKELKEIVE
jgi:hypothetical protein